MKRLFLLILSFMFLGGAVSSSAFYISSSLNIADTQTSGGGDSQSDILENDEVTANAPTNSGYWTDAGNYATSFAGGSGTSSDPYLISTPQQLAYLSYLVNNSSTNSRYASLYYEQTANLDMSNYYWKPIGSSSYSFEGCFNGGNFTISNIYVNGTSYQGLFGYTWLAEICNVNIDYFEATSTTIKSNIGCVVGYGINGSITNVNVTNAYISNCYSSGGIVGSQSNGIISYCSFLGNIIVGSAQSAVGGIIGSASGSEVFNCHNLGNISDNKSSQTESIGGIIGYWTFSNSNDNTIYNCVNSGNIITGYGDSIGGIVGETSGRSNDILRCYNIGNLSGEKYIGGIVGYRGNGYNGDTSFYDCYNKGNINAVSYAGGIVGYFNKNYGSQEIVCCYNIGNIVKTSSGGISGIGGIIGSERGNNNLYLYIRNCINAGEVNGSTIGGMYRYNCYYVDKDSSGDSVCTIEDIQNQNWYLDSSNWYSNYPWDFENTWMIVEGVNDGLPILRGTTWAMSFTITYHPNGASGDEVVESKVGSESYTIRSNMFSRSGYNFTGWNTEANGNGTSYSAGSSYSELANLDLYAQWSRITYTIKYNKNASDATGTMASTTKYYGTNVTLRSNAFKRTGYSFAGWATSSGGAVVYANGATYKANANVTLYAKWTAHKYIVKFNGNGSTSGSMKEQSFEYGTEQKLTSNAFKKTGFTFSKWTRNADGTGTSYTNGQSVKNLTSTNGAEIKLYAQWKANNEAKYDSAGKYWYVENGKIPQTKVTNSTLISNLNKATTNGGNYYIAGQPLTAKVYNGTEYCKWNNNWYEVEPIKWRLDASSSQKDGYGTTTATNAVLAEIVYVGQYSSTYLGSGAGYSPTAVTELLKNGIDTSFLSTYTTTTQTFGSGTTMYGTKDVQANMFVSSQSEITAVNGDLTITFSDLVEDIIKSYGGTNVYFTRDLGSNYNNITCINAVGKETQCFATNFRGLQFTVRFTEYGCVN